MNSSFKNKREMFLFIILLSNSINLIFGSLPGWADETRVIKQTDLTPPLSSSKSEQSLEPAHSLALKNLDFYLQVVHKEARRKREWGGGVLMGLGAASAVGGIITATTGSSAEVPISLGISAAVLGGIGFLVYHFPTDEELNPLKFQGMPENTPQEISEKQLLGESYLSIFAHQAKRNRILNATANLIIGTALVGWYASENQGNYRVVNSFLLYEGGLIGILGLVRLFIESDAEIALKDYSESKSKSQTHLSQTKFSLLPLPTGGLASLSFSF